MKIGKELNKNNTKEETFLFYIKKFFLIIAIFFITIVLTYAIPEKLIEENTQISLNRLDIEGMYSFQYFETESAMSDNFTNKLILENNYSYNKDYSFIQNAMYNNDYARYWHGYVTVVKPLSILFTYQQIRYILMFVFFSLLCVDFSLLHKKTNIFCAFAFLLSIVGTFFVTTIMNVNFSLVYLIMLVSCLIILKKKKINYNLLFMVTGMVTCFFDFLTAPLITLGYPMIVWCLINKEELNNKIINIIKLSLIWLCGFALTWLSKWILSSLILQKSIFPIVKEFVLYRVSTGTEEKTISRLDAILLNFKRYFLPLGNKSAIVWVLVVVMTIILSIKTKAKKFDLSLILVCLVPIVWYFVLANHSYIHSWYTFRLVGIIVFGLLSLVFENARYEKTGEINERFEN